MSISVAMAVYNGEKYLNEQINSILLQLGDKDEIVISYDKSSDNTHEILLNFAKQDPRVKIFNGPYLGVVPNFENALQHCKNDYIFLSDQDDVWSDCKVTAMLHAFECKNADVILHDCEVIGKDGELLYSSFFRMRHCRQGFWRNVIRNSYIGCCMAVRRDFLWQYVLPFPHRIPMHDQWIGLMAERHGIVEFLDMPLIKYRRHTDNASKMYHSGLLCMIKRRLNLIIALFERL